MKPSTAGSGIIWEVKVLHILYPFLSKTSIYFYMYHCIIVIEKYLQILENAISLSVGTFKGCKLLSTALYVGCTLQPVVCFIHVKSKAYFIQYWKTLLLKRDNIKQVRNNSRMSRRSKASRQPFHTTFSLKRGIPYIYIRMYTQHTSCLLQMLVRKTTWHQGETIHPVKYSYFTNLKTPKHAMKFPISGYTNLNLTIYGSHLSSYLTFICCKVA